MNIQTDDLIYDPTSAAKIAELCIQIARRFRRDFTTRLSPFGLTFTQGQALRVVARSSAPLRMVDLALKLEVVPRSATSMIDALEERGLVRRMTDASDRRSVSVEVTDLGDSLLSRIDELRVGTASELFAHLSAFDSGQLIELLEKASGANMEIEPGPNSFDRIADAGENQ